MLPQTHLPTRVVTIIITVMSENHRLRRDISRGTREGSRHLEIEAVDFYGLSFTEGWDARLGLR
jgi:hypothetical protein